MADLLLIRHGETEANRELRFQGQIDVGLNAIGFEQARRLAERVSREPARALYASDLLRARQTADAIAQRLALAPLLLPELREQNFGAVDGLCIDDIKARHPEAWQGWLRFDADYRLPQGECTREFHARVIGALRRLAADHRDDTIAVVTHGGVLDMVWRTARSLSLSGPRDSEIPNAGLNLVRVADGRFEIVSWGETAHLADLPPQPVYDQRKVLSDEGRPSAG
jgi:probable phosphoglycerate mutase